MKNANRALSALRGEGYVVYPAVGSWKGRMEVGYMVVDDRFLSGGYPVIRAHMVDQEAIMCLTRTGLIWQATVLEIPLSDPIKAGNLLGQFKSLPSTQVPCYEGWTYCTTEGKYYVVD